jgi:hypothetical protein
MQDVQIRRAILDEAQLTDVEMQRADLMASSLRGASLFGTSLNDAMLFATDWRRAKASASHFKSAYMAGAQLDEADFSFLEDGALAGVAWFNASLDRTRLRHGHLGNEVNEEFAARFGKRQFRERGSPETKVLPLPDDRLSRAKRYRDAREVFLALKNNFNSIGRYRDASWAYQRERAMEREQLQQIWLHRETWSLQAFGSWVANWGSFLSTGYGERPERAGAVAGAVIFVFACLYYGLNNIDANYGQGIPSPARLCFWDALIFSGATFFTAGFGTMEPLGRLARFLTVLESGLGITLIALFIFTLGNRISRS